MNISIEIKISNFIISLHNVKNEHIENELNVFRDMDEYKFLFNNNIDIEDIVSDYCASEFVVNSAFIFKKYDIIEFFIKNNSDVIYPYFNQFDDVKGLKFVYRFGIDPYHEKKPFSIVATITISIH